MKTLIIFLAGAFFWQTITLLTAIISKENEDATFAVGFGVYSVILRGVQKIAEIFSVKNYCAAMIDTDGKLRAVSSRNADDFLALGWEWAEYIREKYVPADGWKKSDCFMNYVNLRYTPIKVLRVEKAKTATKAEYAAAKKANEIEDE